MVPSAGVKLIGCGAENLSVPEASDTAPPSLTSTSASSASAATLLDTTPSKKVLIPA
jgi:hypothetical protein